MELALGISLFAISISILVGVYIIKIGLDNCAEELERLNDKLYNHLKQNGD